MNHSEKQVSPSAFTVESNGIEPVPHSNRYGRPRHLFGVWFGGNLSFAYLVIGAVVWSFDLSLLQSVLAIAIGVSAFWVVGYLGVPGRLTGLPTMAYSARYFGQFGNRVMALVSWINLLGWETIVLIIATYAIATVIHLGFGVAVSSPWLVVSLVFSALLELSIAFFGHKLIELFQQWISYIFGLLTILVLISFLPHVAWHAIVSKPTGPWIQGMVPAITIVIASSALSWVTTASDYTRYLPMSVKNKNLVHSAAWGAMIPTGLLMLAGVLLGNSVPNLASAVNPIELLLRWVPAWAAIPYLLVTAVGIIAGGIMCAYSSGLSLLAAGIRIPRSRTIGVDAIVSVGSSLYVLLVSQKFVASFEAFLSIIACFLAPWAAIAIVNVMKIRLGSSGWALGAWAVGAVVSLTTTATSIFTGPLAVGILQSSSLGYFIGFIVTLILYSWGCRGRNVSSLETPY